VLNQSLYQTYRRYQTLRTGRIRSMPIAILMPHSSCNCRCVMCDIWKGNKNRQQLTQEDIKELLLSFKKLGTKQVVMSGGEALLNEHFFQFCELLRSHSVKITLLSTGLLLKRYANEILRYVNDVIVSLDGDPQTHDAIRNIDGAFERLKEGVQYIKAIDPSFKITARSVIQRLNFRSWGLIIDHAKDIGLDSISFLPADISSEAFNREKAWDKEHQSAVAIHEDELGELETVVDELIRVHVLDFDSGFICESREKIKKIHGYYSAIQGLSEFPVKQCNAPWVSTVVEADGKVRPCFFHKELGNIREHPLDQILNSEEAYIFRTTLNMEENETCRRCVCSLNLPFYINPAAN
jgi:Fe-coproporphyrin III synthase